jgi:peptide/nickel transport system permease protein
MNTAPASPLELSNPRSRRWPRWLGLGLLLGLLALAVLGPGLAGHDPRVQDLQQVRAAPSAQHWLGTDHLGRDQLARLAAALRLSLGLALATVASAAAVGTALGLWAAWRGGWVDRLTVALANGVVALPGLLLVLLVAAAWPGSFTALYAGLAVALWVEYFRVVRALAVGLLASPQVEASRLLGFGWAYVLRRHLAPPLWPLLATLACFGSANAVLAMAALGFVGVGLQPPTAELGVMLVELLPTYQEAPWLLAAPASALCALLLGLVLLAGDRGTAP